MKRSFWKTLFDLPPTHTEIIDEIIKKSSQIQLIKQMQKLQVEEGDIIVIECVGQMTDQTRDYIETSVKSLTAKNIKVAILEDGVKLKVLKKQEAKTDVIKHGTKWCLDKNILCPECGSEKYYIKVINERMTVQDKPTYIFECYKCDCKWKRDISFMA